MTPRGRTVSTREQRKNLLILGEGESEHIYFKGLRSRYPHMNIISQNGKGGGSYDNMITTIKKVQIDRGWM